MPALSLQLNSQEFDVRLVPRGVQGGSRRRGCLGGAGGCLQILEIEGWGEHWKQLSAQKVVLTTAFTAGTCLTTGIWRAHTSVAGSVSTEVTGFPCAPCCTRVLARSEYRQFSQHGPDRNPVYVWKGRESTSSEGSCHWRSTGISRAHSASTGIWCAARSIWANEGVCRAAAGYSLVFVVILSRAFWRTQDSCVPAYSCQQFRCLC